MRLSTGHKRWAPLARYLTAALDHTASVLALERTRTKRQRDAHLRSEAMRDREAFFRQREAIVLNFSSEQAINGLFEPLNSSPAVLSVLTTQDMAAALNGGHPLIYFNGIEHDIMALVAHLVNTLVVDLNLRRQFIFDDPVQQMPSSFLFRENVIDQVKNIPRKRELLQILAALADKTADGDSTIDLVARLDQMELKSLLNHRAQLSDVFDDVEFWRTSFTHNKSGQYRNYEHADTLRSIASLRLVAFESPQIDDSEFVAQFEAAFAEHRLQRDNHPLHHLNLILGLIRALLGHKQATPSVYIFHYLLERLLDEDIDGELTNLQHIVYQLLPRHQHRQTVLASMLQPCRAAPLQGYHFEHLITAIPDFLKSLTQYQVRRHDVGTLKQLLGYFRLHETREYEKTLLKSTLTGLVSRSRFTSLSTLALPPDITYDSKHALVIGLDTLYTAIDACIELQAFEFVDLLLSKLVLFYVRNDAGDRKVALSFGSGALSLDTTDYRLLLAEGLTPTQFSKEIFTKELFVMLLKACREGKDAGRLLWLMPHLDLYVETHLNDNAEHIDRIRRFYHNSIVLSQYTHLPEFESHERDAAFDTAFLDAVYTTLQMFGIDGKVYTYNKLFHFDETIERNVRQRLRNTW